MVRVTLGLLCAAAFGCGSGPPPENAPPGPRPSDSAGGGADARGGAGAADTPPAVGGTAGSSASGTGNAGAGGAGNAGAGGTPDRGGASNAGARADGGAAPAAGGAGSPSGGASASGPGGRGGAGMPVGGASGTGADRGGAANGAAAGNGGRTSGAAGSASAGQVCDGAAPAHAVTIHVIGDSTASVYGSSYYPRMGWGQPLGDRFAPQCAVVSDKALSGRSSKSFADEGNWMPIVNALEKDDVVLIQFAHNDEKSDDPTRYTDPETTYKQYLTTYVTDTRGKQAVPILVTPIVRNQWNGTALQDTHGAYPPAMRELARELDVELIDLTAITEAYFERIGQTATTALFLNLAPGESPNYPNGNSDNTHLQEAGARAVGALAVYDAYQQGLTLSTYLKAVPTAP